MILGTLTSGPAGQMKHIRPLGHRGTCQSHVGGGRMHGVASQYQHHSSGGHGATHCLYLYIVSRYAIFSASDRNQISTWPQSIVFQFSCAIDRADGCASKVIHSPVSGCAYLFRAQFLRGEGVESAPGLVVGDVQWKSLLFI